MSTQPRENFASPSSAGEVELPRLNVVFFCESKHLYDVAGQSSADRRLKKSKVSIYSGGIIGAVEMYQDKPTPDLLVIESNASMIDLLASLENLAGVCDAQTKVIIVGDHNDVNMYRELMRQGISEYLVLPLTPGKIIDSLSQIYGMEQSAPLCRSVSFIGAVGGAGTSILAQNFAVSISSNYGLSTCFVDLDIAYGSAIMNWNVDIKRSMADLLSSGDIDDNSMLGAVTKVYDNLCLLGSPVDPSFDMSTVADTSYEKMYLSTRRLNDLVIADIPYGELTPLKQSALLTSTDVYIVTVPTIKGIRNLSILFESIKELRPNDLPPKIIFTQVGNPDILTLNKRMIVENLGRDADHYIVYAPEVIDRALAEGLPLSEVKDGEDISADIDECILTFLGRQVMRKEMSKLQKFLSDLLKN